MEFTRTMNNGPRTFGRTRMLRLEVITITERLMMRRITDKTLKNVCLKS